MGDCECKFGETKSSTQLDIKCIPPTPIPGITNLFPLLQVGGELPCPKKLKIGIFMLGPKIVIVLVLRAQNTLNLVPYFKNDPEHYISFFGSLLKDNFGQKFPYSCPKLFDLLGRASGDSLPTTLWGPLF